MGEALGYFLNMRTAQNMILYTTWWGLTTITFKMWCYTNSMRVFPDLMVKASDSGNMTASINSRGFESQTWHLNTINIVQLRLKQLTPCFAGSMQLCNVCVDGQNQPKRCCQPLEKIEHKIFNFIEFVQS